MPETREFPTVNCAILNKEQEVELMWLNALCWCNYVNYELLFLSFVCHYSWLMEARQQKPRWVLETSFSPLMAFPQMAWITSRPRTRLRPAQATSASLCRGNSCTHEHAHMSTHFLQRNLWISSLSNGMHTLLILPASVYLSLFEELVQSQESVCIVCMWSYFSQDSEQTNNKICYWQ